VISPADIRVLFLVVDDRPSADLAKIAIRRGWPLLQTSLAGQTVDEVRRHCPEVAVVQVSLKLGEDLELLYLLQAGFSEIASIAVATSHDLHVERAVRSAGANCYLPCTDDADLIERTVDELLHRRRQNPPRRPELESRRRGTIENFLPLPPSLLLHETSGGGPKQPAAR